MGRIEDKIGRDKYEVAGSLAKDFDVLPGVGNLVADAVDDEIPVRLSSGHSAGEGSRVVAICPQICSSCWQGLAASGDGPDLVAARRCRTRQGAA